MSMLRLPAQDPQPERESKAAARGRDAPDKGMTNRYLALFLRLKGKAGCLDAVDALFDLRHEGRLTDSELKQLLDKGAILQLTYESLRKIKA